MFDNTEKMSGLTHDIDSNINNYIKKLISLVIKKYMNL